MSENQDNKSSPIESGLPVFTFRRMSGLDQVTLKTDYEWQNLDKLDPQIWMALSCPTKGLQFNQQTLELLDADHDGRIRAQDTRNAVSWVCERVVHPARLCESSPILEMDNLRDDTGAGNACIQALNLIREKKGNRGNSGSSIEDIANVLAEASGYPFNGDGIVPPDSAPEMRDAPISEDMRKYIATAISIVGAKRDASGKPGLNQPLADELAARISACLEWRNSLRSSHLPLGAKTGEAWTLFTRLEAKIEDYFCRCELAAFNPSALSLVSMPESALKTPEAENDASTPIFVNQHVNQPVNQQTIAEWPISRINPECVLNLREGLNPAWADTLHAFINLLQPVLESDDIERGKLELQTWKKARQLFGNYADVMNNKPVYDLPPADAEKVSFPGLSALALAPAGDALERDFLPLNPNEILDGLSDRELEEMNGELAKSNFSALVQKDLAAPPLSSFQDLYRLALFNAYLYTFLMNFLSFIDFYDPARKAIFQEGALYLDSRACLLCVPVENVDDHARLAAQSHLCLVYCSCTRKTEDGATQEALIAACLTIGNLVSLIEGRHGLFIDNSGNEWDSKIVRVVHNPISLREAMWAPYVRASNMIGQQVQKFIAAKDKAIADATSKAAQNVSTAVKEAKPGFDFARGAGIFAAVSVALSVLSAAFAYIARSVASLGWWWPVALVGLFICVSGPSMLIAYFKLRKRSLGPLLDASGWAVNKGAPINLAMGMALTKTGSLPANSQRNLDDPYSLPARIKNGKRWLWFFIVILALLVLAFTGFALYCNFIYEPMWVTRLRLLLEF